MEEVNHKENILWIDCAKFVAVFAVMLDHTRDILYSNQYIWLSSFFSVTAFAFLAGITSYDSVMRHSDCPYMKEIMRRLKKVIVPYFAAVLLYLIARERYFDLTVYIGHVVRFDLPEPAYFIVFYMQLIIVAPLLVNLLKRIKQFKYSIIGYFLFLGSMALLSKLFTNYTYIGSLYGGAQYFCGGTYFFAFSLGLLFAHSRFTVKRTGIKVPVLIGAAIAAISMIVYTGHSWKAYGTIPFDGKWNPPGMKLFIYTLLIMMVIYFLCAILRECRAKKWMDYIGKLGQYSLYIFLYHLLFLNVLETFFRGKPENYIWVKRIIYYPVMIGGSVLIAILFKFVKRRLLSNR